MARSDPFASYSRNWPSWQEATLKALSYSLAFAVAMPLAIMICVLPALFFARIYFFVGMERFLEYPVNVPLVFVANIPAAVRRDWIIRSTVWRVIYTGALAGSTILADVAITALFGEVRVTFFPWVFIFLVISTGSALTLKADAYWIGDKACQELDSSSGNDWRRDSSRLCRMAATDCVVHVILAVLFSAGVLSFLNLAVFSSSFDGAPAGFIDNDLLLVYAGIAFEISLLIGNRIVSRYPEFLVVAEIAKIRNGRRALLRTSPYDPLGARRRDIFMLARYVERASAKLERSISRDATFAPSVVLRAGAAELLRFLASRDSLDVNPPKKLDRNLKSLFALVVDTPSRSFYDNLAYEWKAFDESGRPAGQPDRSAPRRIEEFFLQYSQPSAASLQFLIQGSLAAIIVALALFGRVDVIDFVKTFIK
ncbi:hypothetical protein AB0C02_09200 [Micromonospora sp. NPDC048999]|uniref:hypothetical protein n=1 Tax=Micromonospora sp. NPDC048999 TaxID=3155391 RepID=UPI0033C27BC9